MGLDINGTQFLLYAEKMGVKFQRTAMIGRQNLALCKRELKDLLLAYGYKADDKLINQIISRNDGYAEQLFKLLGAVDVHSFDMSSYEGATNIFDMNMEIPDSTKEQYSAVLDGGSLEHIFNFPVAMKNCMEMTQIGGHYLGILPANNFMGHGFYQFSPELFFSIFTRENGFELINVIAFEDRPKAKWYSVKSPMEIRSRVTLVNKIPVYLLIVAKRLAKTAIFAKIPQQSDYVSIWNQGDNAKISALPDAMTFLEKILPIGWLKTNLPSSLKRRIKRVIQHSSFGFDSRFFQPFDPKTINFCKCPKF